MTIIDKCQKQCPPCKLTSVFLIIKHRIWIFTKVIGKVEQDNEIQPPESRDAIGKLSNKKTMRLYIKIRVYIQILCQFLGLSNKQKKKTKKKTTSSVQNTREVTIGALSLHSTYNDHCAY